MPPVRHSKLPLAQWEGVKETIRRLYLDRNFSLEGADGVIQYMSTHHDLHASKAQYEAQFRRWGFRKKLTKDTWHSIWHIIENRKKEGRASEVYLLNARISDEKVKKEISRYKNCDSYGAGCSAETLPRDIEIRDTQPVQNDSTSNSRQTTDLPFGPLETTLDIEGSVPQPTEPTTRETSRATSRDQDSSDEGLDPINLRPSPFFATEDSGVADISLEEIYTIYRVPTTQAGFADIFEMTFGNSIQYGDGIVNSSAWNYAIPESTNSILRPTRALLLDSSRAVYRDSLPAINASIDQTMSLLPRQAQRELQNLTPDAVVLKQILFLLMNNFANDDHPAFTKLFEQIKHFSTAQIEHVLTAFPEPYSLALQQSVLILAIKADVPSIVKLLLDRGLHINLEPTHSSPFTLACKLRHIRIVKTFLQSDIDLSSVLDTIIWQSLVMNSEYNEERDVKHKSHQLLELLLSAGGKVSSYDFSSARFADDVSLLDVYIKYVQSPTKFKYASSLEGAFKNIIAVHDSNRITSAVIKLVGEDFHISHGGEKYFWEVYQKLLQHASLEGNATLVNFLLERGVIPDTYCLCQAIRGNNEQIARRYIQDGLKISQSCEISRKRPSHDDICDLRQFAGVLPDNVDPLLKEGIYTMYEVTTPFAEAVRWKRQNFILMFKEMGIMNMMVADSDQISSVLLAASEVGSQELVQYLLGIPSDLLRETYMCYPLAALGGHDDIIMMLMASGVQPRNSLMTAAVAMRNPLLVHQLMHTPMYQQTLSTALYFAVRWGDINVVRDLVTAGAYLDTHEWDCEEWVAGGFPGEDSNEVSPLKESIKIGHLDVARFLLESGADINDKGLHCESSPLSVAVQYGDEDFVRELLRRGADPKDREAIKSAVSQSNQIFEIVLKAVYQCYPNGDLSFASDALREAIKNEDEAIVGRLGAHINVNSRPKVRPRFPFSTNLDYLTYDPTLFSEAIRSRHINIIRALLACGGDPNSTAVYDSKMDNRGRWTVFLDAIATDDIVVVRLLHEAGANLNEKAVFGIARTPLQLAVERGKSDIIEYLLEHGAEVNADPCLWGGATTLQIAAIKGNVGLAERLIEKYKADINAPACKFQGRTAFEGAAEHGRLDMLLMLYHKKVDLISDGGTQVRRAIEFAEKNGQMAAKALVEQIWQSPGMDIISFPEIQF